MRPIKKFKPGQIIGVDWGEKKLATFSDGKAIKRCRSLDLIQKELSLMYSHRTIFIIETLGNVPSYLLLREALFQGGYPVFRASNNFPSSQICSGCKLKSNTSVSSKIWRCKFCNAKHQRDINAAKVLELLGKVWIGYEKGYRKGLKKKTGNRIPLFVWDPKRNGYPNVILNKAERIKIKKRASKYAWETTPTAIAPSFSKKDLESMKKGIV